MLSRLHEQLTESPRAPFFWAVIGTLVTAQFVALYLLCAHQVQIAQVRDSKVAAHGTAIRDCLETTNSTIGSCFRTAGGRAQAATQDGVMLVGGRSNMATAVPANFAYR